jgi:hypothetical protein
MVEYEERLINSREGNGFITHEQWRQREYARAAFEEFLAILGGSSSGDADAAGSEGDDGTRSGGDETGGNGEWIDQSTADVDLDNNSVRVYGTGYFDFGGSQGVYSPNSANNLVFQRERKQLAGSVRDAAQKAADKCVEKLDAVLKALIGEKAFGKLHNAETNTTGFLAHMADMLQAGRVLGVIGGNSNYNPGTGKITLNIDPSRGEGFRGKWAAAQRLEFIHEGLHSAKRSGFDHEDIYRAMSAVDGLDFRKFTKDRANELKNRGVDENDDSMYRDAMNRWIRQYCE